MPAPGNGVTASAPITQWSALCGSYVTVTENVLPQGFRRPDHTRAYCRFVIVTISHRPGTLGGEGGSAPAGQRSRSKLSAARRVLKRCELLRMMQEVVEPAPNLAHTFWLDAAGGTGDSGVADRAGLFGHRPRRFRQP